MSARLRELGEVRDVVAVIHVSLDTLEWLADELDGDDFGKECRKAATQIRREQQVEKFGTDDGDPVRRAAIGYRSWKLRQGLL